VTRISLLRLGLLGLALLKDGVEVQRDTHPASTGNAHSNNVFAVTLDAAAFNAKYTLRAEVRTEGGNDSNGSVWIKKE
jgi:hexosaminidase